MKSAVTLSLVPQAKGGPFVFWGDISSACQSAGRLGFDGIELFPLSTEALDPVEFKQELDRNSLALAAVGTGAGWVVHRWHLTHQQSEIRRKARSFIRVIIDWASHFNAPVIIGSMQGRAESPHLREEASGWLGEALEELGEAANAQRIQLLFEPLNRYETNLFNRLEETIEFLDTLKARNIKILADLFHMNVEEASIPETLRSASAWIGHIHWADSNRRAVGFGHTPIEPIIAALSAIHYQGYLSAEILPFPHPEGAARQTFQSFRQCLVRNYSNAKTSLNSSPNQ
jgi:sugar phosphate isomerase/epimerase